LLPADADGRAGDGELCGGEVGALYPTGNFVAFVLCGKIGHPSIP